ncbi:hypothetical protein Tco_0945499 [Tanacetum coccineum]
MCLSSSSQRLIVASLSLVEFFPEYVRDTLLPDRLHQGGKLHFLHLKLSHFLASHKYAIKVTSLKVVVKFILYLGEEGKDMFHGLASPTIHALNVASLHATSHENKEATCHKLGQLPGTRLFTSNCKRWLNIVDCLFSFAEMMTLKPKTRHKALSLCVKLAVSFQSHRVIHLHHQDTSLVPNDG